MQPPHETPPGGAAEPFVAGFRAVRALLGGPGRGRRLRSLTLLSAMAGIVGAGAAPPPLGLLAPVWETESLRNVVLGNPTAVALLVGLAVFLTLAGAVCRSFTFAFLAGLVDGRPSADRFRAYLRPGIAHFVWSSAISIPLYLLLFAGEWMVTRDAARTYQGMLSGELPVESELQVLAAMAAPLLRFLLVLVPWTLLTLPLMVWMYELTPAAMLGEGKGPTAAARSALARVSRRPGGAPAYLGLRLAGQILGNMAAFVALVPCLALAGLVCSPLLIGGWLVSGALGGTATGAGISVLAVSGMLSAVVLYVFLCGALLPVSIVLNAAALRAVDARRDRLAPTGPTGPGAPGSG